MQKVALRFVVAGRELILDASEVEAAVRDLEPEPVREHFVVVGSRRYPPKQPIAAVSGVDRADFTTNQARSILRRLGFATGRRIPQQPAAEHSQPEVRTDLVAEAEELRPHRGRWVAIKDGVVIVAAESPRAVLAWLRTHSQRADTMFRVPVDPSVDMGGFSS